MRREFEGQPLYDWGLDIAQRRIYLLDDIDSNAISHVIKGLYHLAALSKAKIELFVGSFGGCEYEMLGLYDTIQSVPNDIETVAIGKCMSAGPLLVACGTLGMRYSLPNTSWMVHQGWEDFGQQRYDELARQLKHREIIGNRWLELMEKHTSKPASYWNDICSQVGDTYFDSTTAVALGLVDQIWIEK